MLLIGTLSRQVSVWWLRVTSVSLMGSRRCDVIARDGGASLRSVESYLFIIIIEQRKFGKERFWNCLNTRTRKTSNGTGENME